MKVVSISWTEFDGWNQDSDAAAAQLVLYFAAPSALSRLDVAGHLAKLCPAAKIVGCSTGGEIAGNDVNDDSVSAVAVHFDTSQIKVAHTLIASAADSHQSGRDLAQQLPQDGLRGVFVLADGIRTNGTALVAGLREIIPPSVLITGGLAGDGADFKRTLVGVDTPPVEGVIAAIGFYGASLHFGWGSVGGWERFGPERIITKSEANILYELDGEPALDLYKRYLGDEAANLPASGLLFPLTVRPANDESSAVVRTIVGIDEDKKSMLFAGDIPQGYVARLMRGNFDDLVAGSQQAGEKAALPGADYLALLVSCIGRKLLMGQNIADETEAAFDALGQQVKSIGFYSYGEIAPHAISGRCELHNQTMTITTISEG